MLAQQAASAARSIVVIDPRRTDDRRGRRPASCGLQPGTDVALFTGLLVASRRQRRARPRLSSPRTRRGFDEALARAREHRRQRRPRPRCDRPRRARCRAPSTSCSRDTRARRHAVFAGREPVGAGHRQGQRHHQLPSRHRPHRQARRGAVLAHRPAQRDGRARGRRPRQPARRAYGFHAARHRPRAAVLERAAHRRRARA